MPERNWVERRFECQQNLARAGVWLKVRASLEESIDLFKENYGNSYGQDRTRVVNAEPINGHRFTVKVEAGAQAGLIVGSELDVNYIHRNQDDEASIKAEWKGSMGRSADFRVACVGGEVMIMRGDERCSPDRVAEIILRDALFGGK